METWKQIVKEINSGLLELSKYKKVEIKSSISRDEIEDILLSIQKSGINLEKLSLKKILNILLSSSLRGKINKHLIAKNSFKEMKSFPFSKFMKQLLMLAENNPEAKITAYELYKVFKDLYGPLRNYEDDRIQRIYLDYNVEHDRKEERYFGYIQYLQNKKCCFSNELDTDYGKLNISLDYWMSFELYVENLTNMPKKRILLKDLILPKNNIMMDKLIDYIRENDLMNKGKQIFAALVLIIYDSDLIIKNGTNICSYKEVLDVFSDLFEIPRSTYKQNKLEYLVLQLKKEYPYLDQITTTK